MDITNINLDACPLQYLSVGYVGETGARPVAFDFSAWAEEYGAGVLQLLLQRPGDAEPYPVLLDIDGTTATWTPDATATEKTGQGQAQLIYTVGGVVVKNAIFRVLIAPSLGAAGNPPEPYEDWLERLLTIAAEAQQSAIDAAGSAEAAGTSAGAAAGSAGAAAQSALDAEAAKSGAEAAETAAGQSATLAGEKAAQAAQSAQTAAQKATDAQQSAEDAQTASTAARLAADAAETFADNAEAAADEANQAKADAQSSASAAAASATSAAASAAVAQELIDQIPDIEAEIDAVENVANDARITLFDGTPLVDYAVLDLNYTGTPGKSDSTCLAVKRRGSRIVLNGGNINNASKPNVFVKLTGNTIGRTINSSTIRNWSDGITLKSGRMYKVTVLYVSGETSAISVPATSLSVDNLGESATIGYASRDGYGRFIRYFVATQELNLILYVPCYQITYTDYTVDVILEEVDEAVGEYLPSMVTNRALAVGDFRIVNGELFRVTAPVASGGTLIPGTNCVKTTLSWEIDTLTDDVDALEAAQPKTVTVTGTTPVIAAVDNTCYKCGEVLTLDITLPVSGCIDVVFESGSTPTVLTVTPPTGVTLKWANGFDPSTLEAHTVYEINIADGLGVAASWT